MTKNFFYILENVFSIWKVDIKILICFAKKLIIVGITIKLDLTTSTLV